MNTRFWSCDQENTSGDSLQIITWLENEMDEHLDRVANQIVVLTICASFKKQTNWRWWYQSSLRYCFGTFPLNNRPFHSWYDVMLPIQSRHLNQSDIKKLRHVTYGQPIIAGQYIVRVYEASGTCHSLCISCNTVSWKWFLRVDLTR